MVNTLRTLLIVLAVTSPLVSELHADGSGPAAIAVRSAVPSPFDGHREDDAGVRAEQAEEDDTEEEVVDDLHSVSVSLSARGGARPRLFAIPGDPAPGRSSDRSQPFSRGPPARR